MLIDTCELTRATPLITTCLSQKRNARNGHTLISSFVSCFVFVSSMPPSFVSSILVPLLFNYRSPGASGRHRRRDLHHARLLATPALISLIKHRLHRHHPRRSRQRRPQQRLLHPRLVIQPLLPPRGQPPHAPQPQHPPWLLPPLSSPLHL